MDNKTQLQRKYKFIESDAIKHNGKTLYRIQALTSFGSVKAGDLGGYIEAEKKFSPRRQLLGTQ